MAGFNVSGGYAASAGADALEDLLKRAFVEQVERRRAAQEDQRIAQEGQRMAMLDAERRDALTAANDVRQQGAMKGALSLIPKGTVLPPDVANRARELGFGANVEHSEADLPSRAISGVATTGAAAPVMGKLRMVQAGRPERDTFTGTADQLAAEQARMDRLKAQEDARLERERTREQNLADKKEFADYLAANRPAPTPHARFNVVQGTDADGKAALIRTNVDTGEVSVLPVPSGANFTQRERPATQDQTNLALYGKRIEQAEGTLKNLESGVSKMPVLSYEAQTRIDHPAMQSKEMQAYQQAARNFIAAVLRRESGAAISQSEFTEARKQYLPMPGDTPETLAQKAKNRKIVYDQFKQGAGPAWREEKPQDKDPLGIR